MTVSPQTEEYACLAARAADELKATSILALDVSQRLVLSEVFLVLSGSSDRQVRAIVDAVEERLHTAGLKRTRREGYDEAHWVLIDYGDLVVHVLQDEDREYYALDRLWADCPVLDLGISADQAEPQANAESEIAVDTSPDRAAGAYAGGDPGVTDESPADVSGAPANRAASLPLRRDEHAAGEAAVADVVE